MTDDPREVRPELLVAGRALGGRVAPAGHLRVEPARGLLDGRPRGPGARRAVQRPALGVQVGRQGNCHAAIGSDCNAPGPALPARRHGRGVRDGLLPGHGAGHPSTNEFPGLAEIGTLGVLTLALV